MSTTSFVTLFLLLTVFDKIRQNSSISSEHSWLLLEDVLGSSLHSLEVVSEVRGPEPHMGVLGASFCADSKPV